MIDQREFDFDIAWYLPLTIISVKEKFNNKTS